jgi:hypothetical protein
MAVTARLIRYYPITLASITGLVVDRVRPIPPTVRHLLNNMFILGMLGWEKDKGRGLANDAVYAITGFGVGTPV